MLAGSFCGVGTLSRPGGEVDKSFAVTSFGLSAGEGLILTQTIAWSDGDTDERVWTLQPDGPHTYRGTLTGESAASGEVRVRAAGDALHIDYPVAGVPLARMRQTLTLGPDGVIANEGTVSLLGVPVRRLTETITPLDAALAKTGETACNLP